MWVLALRLKRHQIDYIGDANLQIGKVLTKNVHSSECFERGHVPGTSHDHVRLSALIIAGPFPNANSLRAMFDRRIHVEVLKGHLFTRNGHVDVVSAAQTVIGDRQQRVCVWRQIDSDDFGLFVYHVIDEARILMAEAVVVLPPDVGSEQIVERSDRSPPRDVPRDFLPFRMLVEHRVDDVNECFVAGKETVASSQQISFEPTLTHVLAQHFHHAAIR